MARSLTRDQIERIQANKALTVRDIAKRVGVSVGAVHKVLNETPARAKGKPAIPQPAPTENTTDDTSPIERLTRAVKSLENAATIAAADGDQARVVAALRAVSDITKTIAALAPPPPPNHDESPDVVAAAKRFREKVFGLFDRIASEQPS